jgi:Mn-dependent DtxR family transcriptional regulator
MPRRKLMNLIPTRTIREIARRRDLNDYQKILYLAIAAGIESKGHELGRELNAAPLKTRRALEQLQRAGFIDAALQPRRRDNEIILPEEGRKWTKGNTTASE